MDVGIAHDTAQMLVDALRECQDESAQAQTAFADMVGVSLFLEARLEGHEGHCRCVLGGDELHMCAIRCATCHKQVGPSYRLYQSLLWTMAADLDESGNDADHPVPGLGVLLDWLDNKVERGEVYARLYGGRDRARAVPERRRM